VRSSPPPRASAPPPALTVRCFAAEADRRRALLTAKNILNEMKQLMAEHQSSEAPPGRLRRAFDLFEKRARPRCRRPDVPRAARVAASRRDMLLRYILSSVTSNGCLVQFFATC
jgi:hypothetical protein